MTSLDLNTLRSGYRIGNHTPSQIIDELIARIAAHDDPAIWIHRVSDDELRAAAAALEDRTLDNLPLYGVPFAVKDNIDVAGLPTTAACPDFSYIAAETAPAVQRLLDAGALLVGKTNLDQFATGLVGVRSPYGVPLNALDPSCVPGGSSAGSAVAVSASLVSFSLGTDTAGSGRVPAGFNNIVGVKPTKGLFSTRGVVPACRTLDCVSIFALTTEDGADIRNVMAAFDAKDAYSRQTPALATPQYITDGDLAGVRLGVPTGKFLKFFGDDAYQAAFHLTCDRMTSLGATLVEIDFAPFAETAALLYDGPWVAERYVALREFLEKSPDSFHPVTRAIVENGKNYDAADVYAATYRLADLARRAEVVWDDIDAMLLPTAGRMYTVAEVEADPIQLNSNLGYYTNFVNLLDLAALAVPSGFAASGRPFGVTLVGPAFSDSRLSDIGGAIHRDADVPMGATDVALPAVRDVSVDNASPNDTVLVAVNGAHMRGLPLNHQLIELGATFVREDRTAPCYRLYSLEDFSPIRPGMIRTADPAEGASIALEVWALPVAAIGALLVQIPAPLGLGTLELYSGDLVKGFVCEAAAASTAATKDITAHGGWRPYLEAVNSNARQTTH
ncbi:MAG: allophanate hydrolase [Paracoccaceae bacterium]